MCDERVIEEGQAFRIWLKKPQYLLLVSKIAKWPKDGHERLKTAIKSAQVRYCPTKEMSRKDRAEWIADELLEQISEVETLLEEVQDWRTAQRGTGFEKSAQADEVHTTELALTKMVEQLHNVRVGLKALCFPSWKQAKEAVNRRAAELHERLKHGKRGSS